MHESTVLYGKTREVIDEKFELAHMDRHFFDGPFGRRLFHSFPFLSLLLSA